MVKTKISFIIGSIILVIGGFAFFSFRMQQSQYQEFASSGYILSSKDTSTDQTKTEKYYFDESGKYKETYNESIQFSDIEGDKVQVAKENFIHYTDGSIGTLTKGVIIDMEKLDADPISYYNIFPKSMLTSTDDKFVIDHLGKKLRFQSLLFKISDTKYLIASKKLTLKLGDGKVQDIEGYVELEFVEGGIVKIKNQELTYQTIANEATIAVEDGTVLNLGTKTISKDDIQKLGLGQMVINSDDNVEVMPEEKKKINKEEDKEEDKKDPTQNEQNPDAGQTTEEEGGDTGSNGGSITPTEEPTEKVEDNTPKFLISKMELTSIKADFDIEIQDDDKLLTSTITTKIIDNSTNKIVYSQEETEGLYEFNIAVENLAPDTEYTLVTTGSYTKGGIEYTVDFLTKAFRTESLGINLEKVYLTPTTMAFHVSSDAYSKIKKADLQLLDNKGTLLKTELIDGDLAKTAAGINVEFNGLTANSEYTLRLTNLLYDNLIIADDYATTVRYKTLKNKPTFGKPTFSIDKRNSKFTIGVSNVSDINGGIREYRYEIYDARTVTEGATPLSVISKSTPGNFDLLIDNVNYFRSTPYVFRLVTEFSDNEKIIEYATDYSEVFRMDGVDFPSVRFEETEVTFEKIEGSIWVTDTGNTIKLDGDSKFIVNYKDSTGYVQSYTSTGNLVIPFSQNNLRANETYTISVYADVNLQDGNETIQNCYIGGMVVHTKETKPLVAEYDVDKENIEDVFFAKFQLGNNGTGGTIDNTLEANTLSAVSFNLYAGQNVTGTPVKTVRKYDADLQPYVSDLKKELYDDTIAITPSFFGLRNGDLTDDYYTIEATNAVDYTTYENNIPIENPTVTIRANGVIPDLPTNLDDALDVTVIRNKDAGAKYRSDLDPETILGYRVKARFDNSKKYGVYLKYRVYDEDTKQEITGSARREEIDATGSYGNQEFWLEDGTEFSVPDSVMRRGHRYYFTYEAGLDLNFDGTVDTMYPYSTSSGTQTQLTSRANLSVAKKQPPKFILYPSSSTGSTSTWKYNCMDIDNTLVDNQFLGMINDNQLSTAGILKSANQQLFSDAVFTSLTPGLFDVRARQALIKTASNIENNILSTDSFDGTFALSGIKYKPEIDMNKLVITLSDYNANLAKIKRISALRVTVTSEGKNIVKDYLPLQTDRVSIDLYDLKEFINQDITVSVDAYYDSGASGFETKNTFHSLQRMKNRTGGGEYLVLNNNQVLGASDTANRSIYKTEFNKQVLSLTNQISNQKDNIDMNIDSGGVRYQGDYINLKGIDTTTLTSLITTPLHFEIIVPGISLVDTNSPNEDLKIVPSLRKAQVEFQVFGANASGIKDNKVYVEVYKTNATATENILEQTIEADIQDTAQLLNVTNLNPKTDYYLRFYSYLKNNDTFVKEYLYDLDFRSSEKRYYFATLSDVVITEPKAQFVATTYEDKNIVLSYNLQEIMGYDKIEYDLYHYETDSNGVTTKVPMGTVVEDDIVFKNKQIKNIPTPPGSEFLFGSKYSVTIRPIANIKVDGVMQDIELGTVDYDFNLETLQPPFIGITDEVNDFNKITFRVSISDIYKTIIDGKYKIKILDDLNNDVTPTAYKDKDFSIYTLNQSFVVDNLKTAASYKMIVSANVDMKNNRQSEGFTRTYSSSTLDEFGINTGQVVSSVNAQSRSKIDLAFYRSFNLSKISTIRYSIYGFNGFAINNTVAFTPTLKTTEDETYYLFTLPENLPSNGIYNIEIQFIVDNKVARTISVEHNFAE